MPLTFVGAVLAFACATIFTFQGSLPGAVICGCASLILMWIAVQGIDGGRDHRSHADAFAPRHWPHNIPQPEPEYVRVRRQIHVIEEEPEIIYHGASSSTPPRIELGRCEAVTLAPVAMPAERYAGVIRPAPTAEKQPQLKPLRLAERPHGRKTFAGYLLAGPKKS